MLYCPEPAGVPPEPEGVVVGAWVGTGAGLQVFPAFGRNPMTTDIAFADFTFSLALQKRFHQAQLSSLTRMASAAAFRSSSHAPWGLLPQTPANKKKKMIC